MCPSPRAVRLVYQNGEKYASPSRGMHTVESTRRRLLQVAGSAVVVGVAGCLGNGDEPTATDEETDDEDEETGEGSEGLLYAFGAEAISIIDPESGSVVDELTTEIEDASWGDPQITPDLEQIFVPNEDGAQVLPIETTARTIGDPIDVGPDPLHTYAPVGGEVWIHSDAEGTFYVIDTDSHTVIDTVDIVDGGHGKLLTHPDFGSTAYALNVTEPTAFGIDLEERTVVDEIEFGEVGGGHYKAYTPETGLAYLENSGTGTTAVLDTDSNEVVDELDPAGAMYLSPDDSLLAILDGQSVTIIDATSEESDVLETITVEDEPGVLRYAPESQYAFTANTAESTVTVLDMESLAVDDTIEAGAIDGRRRTGVIGENSFFTPATAEQTVAIVGIESRTLESTVDVGAGVDTLQFVGESGVGYRSL